MKKIIIVLSLVLMFMAGRALAGNHSYPSPTPTATPSATPTPIVSPTEEPTPTPTEVGTVTSSGGGASPVNTSSGGGGIPVVPSSILTPIGTTAETNVTPTPTPTPLFIGSQPVLAGELPRTGLGFAFTIGFIVGAIVGIVLFILWVKFYD